MVSLLVAVDEVPALGISGKVTAVVNVLAISTVDAMAPGLVHDAS